MADHIKTPVSAQVANGARLGAYWVLAIAWIILVASGIGSILSEVPDHRVSGWVCVSLGAILATVFAGTWVKILPGLLGLGVLNALITIWLGHPLAVPAALVVPRIQSTAILLILVACGAVSTTYEARRLTIVHRLALLSFLVSQILAIAWFPSVLGFVLMLLSLLAGWAIDIFRKGTRSGPPIHLRSPEPAYRRAGIRWRSKLVAKLRLRRGWEPLGLGEFRSADADSGNTDSSDLVFQLDASSRMRPVAR